MMQEMNTLYLESLEHQRLVTDLTLVYQILHGHYDTQLDATLCITDNPRTQTFLSNDIVCAMYRNHYAFFCGK